MLQELLAERERGRPAGREPRVRVPVVGDVQRRVQSWGDDVPAQHASATAFPAGLLKGEKEHLRSGTHWSAVMLKSRLPRPISSAGRSVVEMLLGKIRLPVSRDVSSIVDPGYVCSAAMNSSLRRAMIYQGICEESARGTHKGMPSGRTPVSVVA